MEQPAVMAEQPAAAAPLPLPPPEAAAAGERDGLLREHASRSCSPFHALEIQSDEGSSYEPHAKPVLLGGPAATDPTERLLPPQQRQNGEVLPGGVSSRERLRMVILFSVTAAFLYAGAPWWQGGCRPCCCLRSVHTCRPTARAHCAAVCCPL